VTPKQIDTKARRLKTAVGQQMRSPKGTLKDYRVFVACDERGDYTEAHATRLYRDHGAEYCQAVEVNAGMR